MLKLFALSSTLKNLTYLLWWFNKIIFCF